MNIDEPIALCSFFQGDMQISTFPLFWRKISCSWTSSTLEEIASFGCTLGLTEASENGDSTLNKYMITISYSSSYFWPKPCSSLFTSYVWWMNHAFFRFLPTFPACLLHGPPLPWLSGQIPAFIHGIDTAVGTAPSALAWQGLTMQRHKWQVWIGLLKNLCNPGAFFGWYYCMCEWQQEEEKRRSYTTTTTTTTNNNNNKNKNKNIWMVPRELVHAFFGVCLRSRPRISTKTMKHSGHHFVATSRLCHCFAVRSQTWTSHWWDAHERLDLNQEKKLQTFPSLWLRPCQSEPNHNYICCYIYFCWTIQHPDIPTFSFLPSLLETCFPLCQHSCWKHQCHQLQFADQTGCHAHPNLSAERRPWNLSVALFVSL